MSVEDTVKGIGKMMQEENFVGVFQMMPESYQSDLNGVVSEFGNAMDADLWNSVLGIAKDVGYILTERKEVIQGLPFYAQMNQGGELDKQYDGIASMLNNMANSDALTIDSLKEGNVAKIIKLLGEGTMDAMTLIPEADFAQAKEGINMIANAKVEVVSEEGDTAKVKITTEEGEEEMEFKKIDGRWIPAEMAAGWSEMIGELKTGVAEMKTDEFKQNLAQANVMIGMVSGVTSSLREAKTSEEFMSKLGGLMGLLGGGGPGGPGPGGPGF